MQMLNHTKGVAFGKKIASAAMLAAVLLFVGVPRAAADDDGCRRRVAHADHNLHEAIEHHGYTSRQANHWRHELHEARERCWREHKQWWEVHENRWHHDHDWDDHDHDHDHK
jgi:hypothetical protein